jgi:ABC-type oligopeptide transport system substrate-binding subunit
VRLALTAPEREALASHVLREGDPAPFAAAAPDRWIRQAAETLLDRLDFVTAERIETVDLFLLGEADVAVLHGAQVRRLEDGTLPTARVLRASGWDRTYLIRCDGTARWTNDPNFRRWLAESIDRVDLVSQLFGGFGSPAWSLSRPSQQPRWAPPLHRPFDPTSRPVLTLAYEDADRQAGAIASRLKASFATLGVDLRLAPDGPSAELTLIGRQRSSDDPLTFLRPLLDGLGDVADAARRHFDQAADFYGDSRDELAAQGEDTLLVEAHLIPVLRLDAWIAVAPGLRGIEPGWTGQLGLERSWWDR